MNLIQIYSTPVWESFLPNFDNLRQPFLDFAHSVRQQNPDSDSRSAVGGWQSPKNLTQQPILFPMFDFLAQMAVKANFDMQFVATEVYISEAWINIHDHPGCANLEHTHNGTYSGVFYVKAPPLSGGLILTNPGMNTQWQGAQLVDRKNKFNSDRLRIEPVEGKLFLWPSYLGHSVEPNQHNDERISISFNVVAIPKALLQENQQVDDSKDTAPNGPDQQ